MDFNTKAQEVEKLLGKDIALLSLIISVNECDADQDSINGIKNLAMQIREDLLNCCDDLEVFNPTQNTESK